MYKQIKLNLKREKDNNVLEVVVNHFKSRLGLELKINKTLKTGIINKTFWKWFFVLSSISRAENYPFHLKITIKIKIN